VNGSLSLDWLLAGFGALVLLSILTSKVSGRAGLPSLILFLLVGILAGSEGLVGIAFDDPFIAQSLGVVALAYILFAGGLDTEWRAVRSILAPGLALSTVTVVLTAALVGVAAMLLLGLPWLQALLLGAIVSSTDAAAVFSVMRSRSLGLVSRLKRVLEFESGSNDPMAYFLTIGIVSLLLAPSTSALSLLPMFIQQMVVGALIGLGLGRLAVILINRINLAYDGLYPVFTLALVAVVYGAASMLDGNGFLAVYLAGLVMGNTDFIHKRSITRFHDGFAWLMQITMFIVLGLLVFPSQLLDVALPGFLLALVLIFVARPLSVFATLWFSPLSKREVALVSWVGLRGAVPIVLATYPLVMNVPNANLLFNVVFFIVVLSVLLQGPSIPWAAKLLKVDEPLQPATRYPIEFEETAKLDSRLVEIVVPKGCPASGKKILELGLPDAALVVLISRDGQFLVPRGSTSIADGDRLLLLANDEAFAEVRRLLRGARPAAGAGATSA
jgi:cell volume regulation protein A